MGFQFYGIISNFKDRDIKEGNDIKYYEINNELCTFSNSKQIDIKMLESKKPAMCFELFYVS